MKSNSDDILQKLMQKGEPAAPVQHHLSSLGVPLTEQSPGQFGIDTTCLRAFAGIATLSQMLVNDVMEQCGLGITDILVQRKVLPQLTPELHAAGVEWIMIYSRLEAVEKLPSQYHEFSRAVDIVFHCLQS